MENLKRKLIEQYIETKLTVPVEKQSELANRINDVCRIQWARKYQDLESSGKAQDGRAWVSINAMTHSFYHCKSSNCNWGTQIWKKFELMLFAGSLLKGEYRYNYIQMLEPGHVLSIGYPDLNILKNEFIEIERHIEDVCVTNEIAYYNRIMLLNEPSSHKVLKFESENPLFATVASKNIKAMHLGLSRQGYNLLLKKSISNNDYIDFKFSD